MPRLGRGGRTQMGGVMQQFKRKLRAGETLGAPADRRDRGSSLIEILVSMVILSTGVIAVLVALGTRA